MTAENTPKRKRGQDWGKFLDHKGTAPEVVDAAEISAPEISAPPIPEGVKVTPVRGLPTTAWKGQYYRLPLDIPGVIKEGKALAAARGVRVTNAQIVAEGVRLWVEREKKRQ